jgi:hypothetical protein
VTEKARRESATYISYEVSLHYNSPLSSLFKCTANANGRNEAHRSPEISSPKLFAVEGKTTSTTLLGKTDLGDVFVGPLFDAATANGGGWRGDNWSRHGSGHRDSRHWSLLRSYIWSTWFWSSVLSLLQVSPLALLLVPLLNLLVPLLVRLALLISLLVLLVLL